MTTQGKKRGKRSNQPPTPPPPSSSSCEYHAKRRRYTMSMLAPQKNIPTLKVGNQMAHYDYFFNRCSKYESKSKPLHQLVKNKENQTMLIRKIQDNRDKNRLSFDVIEHVQDIFLHILRNFVAESGLVDGPSIRSVMLVCKSWNAISTSKTLWSTGYKCHIQNHDFAPDKCHSTKSQKIDFKMVHSNRFRNRTEIQSSRKIIAVQHFPSIQSIPTSETFTSTNSSIKMKISPKIQDKLIAFAKLNVHSIGSEGICFKTRERATGHFFAIKAPWNFDYDRSNYHTYDKEGKSQPSTALREIAALQRLMGPNYFTNSISPNKILHEHHYGSSFVCLPRAIKMINGHVLRWYDFIEYTLEDFIQHGSTKSKSKKNRILLSPKIIKSWMSQLLQGIEFLHQRGVLHRNIKPKHLLLKNFRSLNDCANENDWYGHFYHTKIVIADFTLVRVNSFPKRPLTPKVVSLWYRPPEILLGNDNYTTSIDMWSIGCIFAEIVTGRALFQGSSEIDQIKKILESVGGQNCFSNKVPMKQSHSNTFKNWLEKKVHGLCNQGIDLLSKLLDVDPTKRITAKNALSHPFVNEYVNESRSQCYIDAEIMDIDAISNKSGYTITNESSNLMISRNLIELEKYITPVSSQKQGNPTSQTAKRKLIRIDQWAKLVDWMIEIVDVFEKHPRTAYLAMNYFHKFISVVKIPTSQHYQLVAATCLHIASKCEDVNCIGLTDLVFSADNTFGGEDIISLEKKILIEIDWRLSDPVLYDFVSLYVDYMKETFELMNIPNAKAYWMVQYISELTLQCHIYLSMYNTSLVAACVLSLSLQCLKNGNFESSSINRGNSANFGAIWPKRLEEISSHKMSTNEKIIQDCRKALLSSIITVKTVIPELKIISKRYRKAERGRVSENPLPNIHRFE